MYDDEKTDDSGVSQRHRGAILLGVVLVLSGLVFFIAKPLFKSAVRSAQRGDFTMIQLPPQPPPLLLPKQTPTPTPPPELQPTPEQPQQNKMEEQQPVNGVQKPAPDGSAPGPLGTSIAGPGDGTNFGLGYGSGIGGFGSGSGDGMGPGSKYGLYASQVQNRVIDALRNNPRTREAQMNIIVRLWPDSTGRITKALVSKSGDPALDSAVQNQVLTGLQLAEPPPADMPLPIVMHLKARRPH